MHTDERVRQLASGTWVECERAVRQFEEAWKQAARPSLDDYLPADATLRHALLIELIHTDLELRLDAGEEARVESYLTRYPELSGDRTVLRELLAAEFTLRRRLQPDLSPDEYLRRFPQYAGDLPTPRSASVRDFRTRALPPAEQNARPDVAGYEILGELGRGGMGVVYKARHVKLNRMVALKMILAGAYADAEERARFHAEAEAAARLQHPNIVQVHEAGDQDGRPFLSLELLDGGCLASQLDGTPWTGPRAAQLIETLARAMHVAHQHGIVHRDLKPANVLLTVDGIPKIADFGLAKRLASGGGQTLTSELTQTGAILGTPSYMAPEQAGGQGRTVGPPADIYALGAILYALLTGRPPFQAATIAETLLQLKYQEPVSPRRLNPAVARDLDTIVLTCLHKRPERRYGSAAALADDLRRHCHHEPVRARPVGTGEQGLLWVRRHPALAALLLMTVTAATAVGGLMVRYVYSKELEASLVRTDEALVAEKAAKQTAEQMQHDAEEARSIARAALARESDALYFNRILLAHGEWRDNRVVAARTLLDDCPRELRQWEWHYLRRLCGAHRISFKGHTAGIRSLAFSPDGKWLVSASDDQQVKVWDAANGKEIFTLDPFKSLVAGVVFSPDGERLAVTSAHGIDVWDLNARKKVRTLVGHRGGIDCVAFSPDGARLVSGGQDATARVWQASSGEEILAFRGHALRVSSVAFSPDGKQIASASYDKTVKVWDADSAQVRLDLTGHAGVVLSVAYSPDGLRLASGGRSSNGKPGEIKVWSAESGHELHAFQGSVDGVFSVAFSPDNRYLAAPAGEHTLKIWNAVTGREIRTLRGHADFIWCVAFSPDGKRLASASVYPQDWSKPGSIEIWDPTTDQEALTIQGHAGAVMCVAFDPLGQRLATASSDRSVKVWSTTTGENVLTLKGHTATVVSVAFSPDGRYLATGSADTTVLLWDATTGQKCRTFRGHDGGVNGVAFGANSQWLASASDDQTVKVWNVHNGEVIRTLKGHMHSVRGVCVSSDGLLASASYDQTVRIWDAATGAPIVSLRGHTMGVNSVAFSPDGRRLASSGVDEVVKIWDVRAGRELLTLKGHSGLVLGVTFNSDGKRLASGGQDQTVKIWDTATGQMALSLPGHTNMVSSVAFSPNGNHLASGSVDRMAKIWHTATGP